ncbi:MAG: bifunctional (p)ppGpp synthetase/guanosine-3',5'-bis(diphosphate) 3'-pyrophosphohydrolase [Chlorobi bacterium]|nr:bifunctional (p)ppGpp synthetase/guanosine-3',5'-bis(diphosphate) 3'-pyrophosphohydrolase [Chlorobiota bacterium]
MMTKNKTEEQIIKSEFEKFLTSNRHRFRTDENIKAVKKAFNFSFKAHENMKRQNGELYISHCLKVAKIVTEDFGLGTTSAVAALLHDVPVKTEYTSEDIKSRFGKKVFNIIEGLIKIKNAEYFENNAEASALRQILISVSDDIRVIFIKIADKLDNIRTLEHLPPESRRKTITEILNIYAPVAHRIGLYNVKDEMENTCLRYNNPYIYNRIQERLHATEHERLQFIDRFIQPIKEKLDKNNIKYKIYGRPKTVYSIWKKMQKKGVKFEEIYDLFAVRIIFTPKNKEDENFEALQTGSLITDLYPEKKERRRDWLKTPKETGYRALHITVMSNEGKWVEVQIRSEEMHEAAEHGLAAHWKYKGLQEKKSEFDEKIKDILDYLNEDNSSALTFIDNLKINLLNPEIFVFTPKGKVISLPSGATVLDFAFKIHTDIGLKAIAGKVNGKTQALDTVLNNGDQVEIITTKNQKPQREWLNFLKTQRALYTVKRIFREDIKKSIEKGKKQIEKILYDNGIDNTGKCIDNLSKTFGYTNKDNFFEDTGEEKLPLSKLKETIKKTCIKQKQVKFWKIKIPFPGNEKKENFDLSKIHENYIIAKCCSPVPGDDISGIKNENSEKIYIHKTNCPEFIAGSALGNNKTIKVKWSAQTKISVLKEFILTGTPEPDTLLKITKKLSEDLNINIQNLNYQITGNQFSCTLKLYLSKENYSNNVIKKLRKLKEITGIKISL